MNKKHVLSKIDRVWIAAVLDCEGGITLEPNGRNLGLGLRVNTKDSAIPRRLHELCEGGIYTFYQTKYKSTHLRWNISGKKAQALLAQIKPYLLTKKRHAEILEELFRETSHPKKMDAKKVKRLLIDFRKLSIKGYRQQGWSKRVNEYLKALKDY